MLQELPDHPMTQLVLNEMTDVLGYDVRRLDSETVLRSTIAAQIALLASGVVWAQVLMNRGLKAAVVAGISVGAYAAAVTADAISLADATRLVHLRAQQMEKMYPVGYGLAAIVGLNEAQVIRLVESLHTEAEPVFVANVNAPRQIVIAGSVKGMGKVLSLAVDQGAQ